MSACEGCGKRPEVYGSSWCASCHDTLPQYTQDRILRLRNALIEVAHGRRRTKVALHLIAAEALQHGRPTDQQKVSHNGDNG